MNGLHFRVVLIGLLICVSGWALRADDPAKIAVTHLKDVCTEADEDDPSISPDGQELFFGRKQDGQWDIMRARWQKGVRPGFTEARAVEELCTTADDISPLLLPREADGSDYVFFASRRGGGKGLDIYFTRRLTSREPFMSAAVASLIGLSSIEDECHSCLVRVMDTPKQPIWELYFSRKTIKGWRIGVVRSKTPRSYDEEQVSLVDLPFGYYHPAVSADGKTMYLQGPVEVGKDRLGLFVIQRAAVNKAWDKTPKPIAGLDDSSGTIGNCSPALSPNGRYLYFASDRSGGAGGLDLYMVNVSLLK